MSGAMARPDDHALLSVRGLRKSFGGLAAVRDLSFDIRRGSITGLIGPNGSGKTTVLNLVTGELRPDAGTILFEGVDIGRHARVRRAIIDKGVRIPPGTLVGYDPEQDRARGFTVSEGGITVIAKADGVEHFAESEMAER